MSRKKGEEANLEENHFAIPIDENVAVLADDEDDDDDLSETNGSNLGSGHVV
jgi:hypothetical protein